MGLIVLEGINIEPEETIQLNNPIVRMDDPAILMDDPNVYMSDFIAGEMPSGIN